jgi:hypothetical protein
VNGHVYPQLPTYRQRNLVHHNNRDGTFTEVAAQLGAPFLEKRVGRARSLATSIMMAMSTLSLTIWMVATTPAQRWWQYPKFGADQNYRR